MLAFFSPFVFFHNQSFRWTFRALIVLASCLICAMKVFLAKSRVYHTAMIWKNQNFNHFDQNTKTEILPNSEVTQLDLITNKTFLL